MSKEIQSKNMKINTYSEFCDKHENKLFNLKFFICIPIIISAILAIILFLLGFYKSILIFEPLIKNHFNIESINDFYIQVLSIADIFLFGIVMIIFSLGTYNLFISKLDNIELDSESNPHIIPNWLKIKSFSALKELFMKVIILILAILFLEKLISINEHDLSIINLLYLLLFPISILFISWSLNLILKNEKK